MIHYQLYCGQGHEFDGWFANSTAFEDQLEQKLVACPFCQDVRVQRALMAPAIGRKSNRDPETPVETLPQPVTPQSAAPTDLLAVPEQAMQMMDVLQQIRTEVEKTCDYVGDDFAEEARKIHYGETDARGIYGETSLDEAQELIEEGIAIAPLPLMPKTQN
jgi:hypothetical protein